MKPRTWRASWPLVAGCAALLLGGGFDLLRSQSRAVTRGNAWLKAGKPTEALAEFDRARAQLPDEPGVRYNRGLALYELGKLDEAEQEFQRASEGHPDSGLKSRASFNQGNVLMKQEKWRDAALAYRRALTADPRFHDAKWNLELALRKEKEQEKKDEQKKEEERKKQEEERKKQEEQQKKEPQPQGPDGGTPQPQSQPGAPKKPEPKPGDDQQPKQPEPEPKPPRPEPKPDAEPPKEQKLQGAQPGPSAKPIDRESVDTVLDALEKHEKNLPLERLRMRTRRKPEKDW
jgi:hypothetical protein